jgi:nucleotide-binding universal stress UspA family protein
MFKKIVWATDGSDSADKALPLVESLAKEGGASVETVHVVEHLLGPRAGGEPLNADEPETQAKLEKQVESLSGDGIEAKLTVKAGHQRIAAHAIADVAKESGADVIIVGTRGHSALGAVLVGSVTQRLLHLAPCPVLVVPDHA